MAESRQIEGRSEFRLDNQTCHWRLVRGGLDIFHSLIDPTGRTGRRRHVTSLQAGDMLFTTAQAGTHACLLANGWPGSVIEPVETASIQPKDLDRWVAGLNACLGPAVLPQDCLILDDLRHDLAGLAPPPAPPGLFRLQLSSCVPLVTRAGVIWLMLPSTAARVPVAIAARLPWLAPEGQDLEFMDSRGILDSGQLVPALDHLFGRLMDTLAAETRLEASAAAARVELRQAREHQVLQDSLQSLQAVISSPLMPEPGAAADSLLAACVRIGRFSGIPVTKPDQEPGTLDAIATVSGFRYRQVVLDGAWWKADCGPLLACHQDTGEAVALLPSSPHSYRLIDGSGHSVKVTPRAAADLSPLAHTLYRPLPPGARNFWHVLKHSGLASRPGEWVRLLMAVLAAGILGVTLPLASSILFDWILPRKLDNQFLVLALLVSLATMTAVLFQYLGKLMGLRIRMLLGMWLDPAIWDRLLRLPAAFFRDFATGDLISRTSSLSRLRQNLADQTLQGLLAVIVILANLVLLFFWSPTTAWLAFGMAAVSACIVLAIGRTRLRFEAKISELDGPITSFLLQVIQGAGKIRIAGTASQAFARWASLFGAKRQLHYRSEIRRIATAVHQSCYPVLCLVLLYGLQTAQPGKGLPTGTFLACLTAFQLLLAAVHKVSGIACQVLESRPLRERIAPLLASSPEQTNQGTPPGTLSGDIEIVQLEFRYGPTAPLLLAGLDLHIRPGEYLAIAGPSGSGKSTLLRLLLGFEQAQAGSIFLDGRDLARLDKAAVRRQMGVVMQDCRIMAGTLYSNIVGVGQDHGPDAAMAAATLAGLDEDIQAMPMGLYTAVNEGGTTLSGGQRQRLLIARALVGNPRIVVFDEATSSLDNRTQDLVTQSLERLTATRIVVAHRLSTLIRADRILVLMSGRIVESGSYSELMSRQGQFFELARRQLI